MSSKVSRREFLRRCSVITLPILNRARCLAAGEARSDAEIEALIEQHRPSRANRPAAEYRERVGAAHVGGKYCLSEEPFLLEGAERLLELGTKVGKFWFTPDGIARSYPFHSRWGEYKSFVALAESDLFRRLFEQPFSTFVLEAHSPVENGWQQPDRNEAFYATVRQEFHDFTVHLYTTYRERDVTFVLQNWEGDWLLRGRGGELWKPPPSDWAARCERMTKWLAARQAGVTEARAKFPGSKCVVAHAAEVNRVADGSSGIPTMTEHVLPKVELDLVSYSSYDGLREPLTLWKCLAEIRQHARTSSLFGPESVYVGEIGIPENDQPQRIAERWDQWLGVLFAADVKYVVQWQLYCNELSASAPKPPPERVTDPKQVRGFWLLKPDGTLSETGRVFEKLWRP